MKSAVFETQNYQLKNRFIMKTKTSIFALTKAFFILLVSCCLFSCSTNLNMEVKEIEQVTRVESSNFPDKGKYWVVGENYNFFTNRQYTVGDTLFIK